jgi:hypothetical protein
MRRGARIRRRRRNDVEPHHLAGRVGIRRLEVDARPPASERLVGGHVLEDDVGAGRDGGEVHDHVGPLRRPQQELALLDRGG